MENIAYSSDNDVQFSVARRLMNISLLAYTILLLITNLVPGKYFNSEIHWCEAGIGLIMFILLAYRFINSSNVEKKEWLKSNVTIFIFLAFGLINWVINDCSYSIARTLYVEGVYLLVIADYMYDKKFISNVIIKVMIYLNLVMNLLPFIVNVIIGLSGYNVKFINLIYKCSYIGAKHVNAYSCFYSNPNAMGIMTGLSIVLAIMSYNKLYSKKKKVLFFIYIIFSIGILVITECRSAMVAFIIALLVYIFIKIIGNKYESITAVIGFLLVIAASIIVVFYMSYNINTGLNDISKSEQKFANVSSNRYIIWKSSYMNQKEKGTLLLGEGSLKNVEAGRDKFINQKYSNTYDYAEEYVFIDKDSKKKSNEISKIYKFYDVIHLNNVINNVEKYKENPRQETDSSASEENISSKSQLQTNNTIENLDTHNGYFSILFCNGIIGFLIFVIIILRKLLNMRYCKINKWILPFTFIVIVNLFESALITERFFPVMIFLLILAMGKKEKQL